MKASEFTVKTFSIKVILFSKKYEKKRKEKKKRFYRWFPNIMNLKKKKKKNLHFENVTYTYEENLPFLQSFPKSDLLLISILDIYIYHMTLLLFNG